MKCRVCDNEENNREYKVKEMMYGYRDEFSYIQCSKCDCLQIIEFPNDMSKYYPKDYYSYQPVNNEQARMKQLLIKLKNNYAYFNKGLIGKLLYSKYPYTALRSIYQLPLNFDSKIIDVGCGAGYLLNTLHEFGFKNLLGIDPFNEKDIKLKNGLSILKKNIHKVQGKWNLIMFHHSFEHVPDPLRTLRSAFNLLESGGLCVIRIPIVSSYAWKYYGVNWIQIDAPRHFFLHSLQSMNILSKKTGFDLFDIGYDSTSFQFWGSEQLVNNIPLFDKYSYNSASKTSMFTKKDIVNFENRSKELNISRQGDSGIFYLRKA